MGIDPTTVNALIAGIFGAGLWSVVVQLIKHRTEKRGVEIAYERLTHDVEEAERKEAMARRADDRQRIEDLKVEVKECQEKREKLQERLDQVREERDRFKAERDEARGQQKETERWLSLRILDCERVGMPCQPKPPPPTDQEQKAA